MELSKITHSYYFRAIAKQPASREPPPVNSENRLFTYAGLPKSTSYPFPITVLTNQGYIAGYCEERNIPAWCLVSRIQTGGCRISASSFSLHC